MKATHTILVRAYGYRAEFTYFAIGDALAWDTYHTLCVKHGAENVGKPVPTDARIEAGLDAFFAAEKGGAK